MPGTAYTGRGKRRERLMQQAVGVRVPAVGQSPVMTKASGLNKRLMVRNDLQAFKVSTTRNERPPSPRK